AADVREDQEIAVGAEITARPVGAAGRYLATASNSDSSWTTTDCFGADYAGRAQIGITTRNTSIGTHRGGCERAIDRCGAGQRGTDPGPRERCEGDRLQRLHTHRHCGLLPAGVVGEPDKYIAVRTDAANVVATGGQDWNLCSVGSYRVRTRGQ